mmetsp:Transcript_113570/g.367419  ORF Transcript_113570/g.367419 Transcript_113570/m.367419 type:complete len:91 (-) Transcript_113570:295-567(-)
MCSSSGRPVVHPTNKGGGLLPCFKLFEGYPYPGERSLAAEQTNPSEDLDFVRDAPSPGAFWRQQLFTEGLLGALCCQESLAGSDEAESRA